MALIQATELIFGAAINENHQRGHEIIQINLGAVNDWINLRAGSLATLWTVGAPCLFEISRYIQVNLMNVLI